MSKVLYSPGVGAGWSTWTSDIPAEFMCMDPTLVAMAEAKADENAVAAYIETKYPWVCLYTGGWTNIAIATMPEGTRFRISEYDGCESITQFDDERYMVAK